MEMKGEGGGGRLEATPTVREGGREGGRRNLCMLQMVMGHLWRRKEALEKILLALMEWLKKGNLPVKLHSPSVPPLSSVC